MRRSTSSHCACRRTVFAASGSRSSFLPWHIARSWATAATERPAPRSSSRLSSHRLCGQWIALAVSLRAPVNRGGGGRTPVVVSGGICSRGRRQDHRGPHVVRQEHPPRCRRRHRRCWMGDDAGAIDEERVRKRERTRERTRERERESSPPRCRRRCDAAASATLPPPPPLSSLPLRCAATAAAAATASAALPLHPPRCRRRRAALVIALVVAPSLRPVDRARCLPPRPRQPWRWRKNSSSRQWRHLLPRPPPGSSRPPRRQAGASAALPPPPPPLSSLLDGDDAGAMDEERVRKRERTREREREFATALPLPL